MTFDSHDVGQVTHIMAASFPNISLMGCDTLPLFTLQIVHTQSLIDKLMFE